MKHPVVKKKPYDADFVPTEEGIFVLSWNEYRNIKALNSSTLPFLAKSPLHAFVAMNSPSKRTDDFDIGTGFHCLVLEPERWGKEFAADWEIDYTGKKVSKNRKDYQLWRESLGDKIVLSAKNIANIKAMAKQVRGRSVPRDLLSSGYPERTVLWKDPKHGFWCKSRLDFIHIDRRVVDLKKTRGADRWAFDNSIHRYKYYWQAWFYLRSLYAVTGVHHGPYHWIAWEDYPPYEGNVYEADPVKISEAGDRIEPLLEEWAACLANQEFPGYSDELIVLGDPFHTFFEKGDDDLIW